MGTPNGEPQEHSRNVIEQKDIGRYIPNLFLLYSCGSLFGVPITVPLRKGSPCMINLRVLIHLRVLINLRVSSCGSGPGYLPC